MEKVVVKKPQSHCNAAMRLAGGSVPTGLHRFGGNGMDTKGVLVSLKGENVMTGWLKFELLRNSCGSCQKASKLLKYKSYAVINI